MKKDRVLKGVLILLSIVFLFCIKAFLFNNSRILDRQNNVSGVKLNENKAYYSKNDVALYLYTFKRLPKNYLTKNEAKKLGWDSSKGNLWKVTDKGVIGGDVFSNREGKLPKKDKYFEADVNYKGGKRGAARLVFTKDGKVIYYTGDHYKNFEVLYE
ncbi:ribonuclease domain-containing protein [Helcococcus ovis]|uniref:Ribonuclease n=1 Tax=Helcococcus ovis TaxID=72026 RepID=A0A4R9C1H5_9FIRM|nr:ribonuclease domain-containing protein [Helcococcus ovis]TFF65223.1 ribonuclease [Helcococcus ovis]TFF65274.1 ribonuclease [Helcococcus ovis]